MVGAAIGLAVGLVLAVGGQQVIQALRSDGDGEADASPVVQPTAESSAAPDAEPISEFGPATGRR